MNLTMGAWGRLHQLWERPLGPLFEKELRVVSRRKGWYALRTAYVSLLLVLVVVTWGIAMARASGGSQTLAMTARMSQAGQSLVMTLVWFQFLSMQLLAVGIMSTAVSPSFPIANQIVCKSLFYRPKTPKVGTTWLFPPGR